MIVLRMMYVRIYDVHVCVHNRYIMCNMCTYMCYTCVCVHNVCIIYVYVHVFGVHVYIYNECVIYNLCTFV